jgi:hypothetical protein
MMNQNITDVGKDKEGKTIPERSIYTQNIVDCFRKTVKGQIVTYEELSELIGMDARPSADGYSYVYSAINITRRDHKINMENIPKVGYQHEDPETRAESSLTETVKIISRKVRAARAKLNTISDKMDTLSPEQRAKVAAASAYLAFQSQVLKPKRIERLESAARESSVIGFKQTLQLFG